MAAEPREASAAMMRRLAAIRSKAGLTQAQTARRMGVSTRWVQALEGSEHEPRLSTLIRYCRVIGVRLTAEVVSECVQPERVA